MSIQYKEMPSTFIEDNQDKFNLLIITATPTEKKEMHKHLQPVKGWQMIIKVQKQQYTYYLGQFGEYNVVHVSTADMGSINRGASIVTTIDAINFWQPKAVLMVGIAFGINKKKQKIGDVLVAERILGYEAERVGKDSSTPRGKEGPTSSLLLDRFKSSDGWEHIINDLKEQRIANVLPGTILSGEKLVDNKSFKKQLTDLYPTAIGGEMEGAGIYSACDERVNHWILVKGICDYGDGNKGKNKDLYQKLAIESAISLSIYVFSSKFGFGEIGLIPADQQTILITEPVDFKKKVLTALRAQVVGQISKQLRSEKYIPATFIETGDQKDHLRYFSDPIIFAEKCVNEIKILDFRYINTVLRKKGFPEYKYQPDFFDNGLKSLTMSTLSGSLYHWRGYLERKKSELDQHPAESDTITMSAYKFIRRIEDLAWLGQRICLITEMAGQGKTNFVCDLTEKFLLKRQIPCLFFIGTEINSADIRGSILKKVFPSNPEISFENLLLELKNICYHINKPFVLIIDGINESGNPSIFGNNLESFISEMIGHEFVRIVITCRTEYYQANFSNLDNSIFNNQIAKIGSLHDERHDDVIKEKLLRTYFDHFGIEGWSISGKVYEQLTSNFLLLRIFCDAYRNSNVGNVENIYKEKLFKKYYDTKTSEINNRLQTSGEFQIAGYLDIKKFLVNIVAFMVEHRQFTNIPLDDLIDEERHRNIYVRFLDENILVRRDLSNDFSVLSPSEVINFTFDEFRDFLICDYLVTQVYKTSPITFESFLGSAIEMNSILLEGCGTYLFYQGRRSQDDHLKSIIESQLWYSLIYLQCIFNLEDIEVKAEDKARIFDYLENNLNYIPSAFYNFRERWNSDIYANLNLEHYYQYLRTLNEGKYIQMFVSQFTINRSIDARIKQEWILESLQASLDSLAETPDLIHAYFEVLPYMFLNQNSWKIKRIYEQYYYKFPEIANKQLSKAVESNNSSLNATIILFCEDYDITL